MDAYFGDSFPVDPGAPKPLGADGLIGCPWCGGRNGPNAYACVDCDKPIHGAADPRTPSQERERRILGVKGGEMRQRQAAERKERLNYENNWETSEHFSTEELIQARAEGEEVFDWYDTLLDIRS